MTTPTPTPVPPPTPQQSASETPPAAPAAAPEVERPDGVSDAEWAALGDPGKAALVRMKQRMSAAEQALAAVRQRPTQPPAPQPEPPKADGKGSGDQPDIAALISQAVAAAMAPMIQQQQATAAEQAAQRVRDGILDAAKDRLLDPTDALAHVDLTSLTDGNGGLDAAKLTAAIDNLVQRKPHLARPIDTTRRALPGSGHGPSVPAVGSYDDQVKARLARMREAAGISTAP
jgi:hypothetical protein